MVPSSGSTTLVCLFHDEDLALAAIHDLKAAGIDESAISGVMNNETREADTERLSGLGIPEAELQHLREGLEDGGIVVVVDATAEQAATVERIFEQHEAEEIDENADGGEPGYGAEGTAAAAGAYAPGHVSTAPNPTFEANEASENAPPLTTTGEILPEETPDGEVIRDGDSLGRRRAELGYGGASGVEETPREVIVGNDGRRST